MHLQDINCIKHRGGIENCLTDIWESNDWELFCKKDVLRSVFDWQFEVFWIVKKDGAHG